MYDEFHCGCLLRNTDVIDSIFSLVFFERTGEVVKAKAQAIARTQQKSGGPISDYESGPDAEPCLVQQSEKVAASVAGCYSYSTSTCVSPIAASVATLTAQRLFFLRSIAGHHYAVVPSVAC